MHGEIGRMIPIRGDWMSMVAHGGWAPLAEQCCIRDKVINSRKYRKVSVYVMNLGIGASCNLLTVSSSTDVSLTDFQ